MLNYVTRLNHYTIFDVPGKFLWRAVKQEELSFDRLVFYGMISLRSSKYTYVAHATFVADYYHFQTSILNSAPSS